MVCRFPLDGLNGGEIVPNIVLVCFRGDMTSNAEGKGTGFPELLAIGVLVFWKLMFAKVLPSVLALGMAPPAAE